MMIREDIQALINYCSNFKVDENVSVDELKKIVERIDLMIYQLGTEGSLSDQQIYHLDDLLNQLLLSIRGDRINIQRYARTIRMIGDFLKKKLKH